MFLSLSAFLETWKKESELTQRILDTLTDDSLKQAWKNEICTDKFGPLAQH
jgi:hypothetical protein